MLKRVLCIVSIIGIVCSFSSCGLFSNSLEDYFSEWESTSDSEIIIIDVENMLYATHDEVVTEDLYEKIGPSFGSSSQYRNTLLFESDNKIYGVHSGDAISETNSATAYIFAMDLTTWQVEILYTGTYGPHTTKIYTEQYYSDGNIIIFDGVIVTKYNIKTATVENIPAEEFDFRESFSYKMLEDDKGRADGKIKITQAGGETVLSVEHMAEKNEYIESLLTLKNSKTLFGAVDPLQSFFKKAYSFNGKLYLVCEVFERDGECNALVFSYDLASEEVKFLYHSFSSDLSDIIIIPRL